jgi:hypothetical protein
MHWFDDERLGFLQAKLALEVVSVRGQAPGLREEVVFVFESL